MKISTFSKLNQLEDATFFFPLDCSFFNFEVGGFVILLGALRLGKSGGDNILYSPYKHCISTMSSMGDTLFANIYFRPKVASFSGPPLPCKFFR